MLKIIKWKVDWSDKIENEFCLCGNKWHIAKGKWKGLIFSTDGFGLSKAERDFFGIKFLSFKGRFTLYFLKWYFSYNNKGLEDEFENVTVYYDRCVKHIIKDKIRELKGKCFNFRENILRKIKFNKEYNFTMYRSWEGEYSFKSDMLSAFQLASNYEADLFLNGKYLLSPLGFEWEENQKLVKKYTGLKWKNLGYKNPYSEEIKNYKKIPY
jgi:hypothetical protein